MAFHIPGYDEDEAVAELWDTTTSTATELNSNSDIPAGAEFFGGATRLSSGKIAITVYDGSDYILTLFNEDIGGYSTLKTTSSYNLIFSDGDYIYLVSEPDVEKINPSDGSVEWSTSLDTSGTAYSIEDGFCKSDGTPVILFTKNGPNYDYYTFGFHTLDSSTGSSTRTEIKTYNADSELVIEGSAAVAGSSGTSYVIVYGQAINKDDAQYEILKINSSEYVAWETSLKSAAGNYTVYSADVTVKPDGDVVFSIGEPKYAFETYTSGGSLLSTDSLNSTIGTTKTFTTPSNEMFVLDDTTIAKYDSSLNPVYETSVTANGGYFEAYTGYHSTPEQYVTAEQISASQIAAIADVPIADVLEALNATQVNAAATMELPELLELIDAVDTDVAATMSTPELVELIASTQVTGQATVLDSSLNVSLSSSPVAAASTMENGLVNLTFAASEQAQASAGMNTLALSDLIDAVQSPAEASVFTGDVGISLNSAQVDSTATVNDTDLFLALTSAQAASEATMLQGDVSPIELLQAAQYAAQSDVNDTRLDALLGATQPQTQAAMNTIESLDEAIGAFQTNVDASMSDVQITLAALDATQIDSVAAQNDADAGFFIEVGSIPTSATAQSEEADVALALVVTAEPTSAVAVIPVRGRFNPRRVDVSASGEDELNDAELTSGRNNWVSND